jgi:hypothetical protein
MRFFRVVREQSLINEMCNAVMGQEFNTPALMSAIKK